MLFVAVYRLGGLPRALSLLPRTLISLKLILIIIILNSLRYLIRAPTDTDLLLGRDSGQGRGGWTAAGPERVEGRLSENWLLLLLLGHRGKLGWLLGRGLGGCLLFFLSTGGGLGWLFGGFYRGLVGCPLAPLGYRFLGFELAL